MVYDVSYWTKVIRRILYVVFILIGLYVGLKLSVFYMPFLVAFVISLIIEPLIKYIMKKTRLTRRTSSIIIFLIVSTIIIGSLIWMIITLFSESSRLLQGLNDYISKVYQLFTDFINSERFKRVHLSTEILSVVQNSTGDILNNISSWVRNLLTKLIEMITSLPYISICIGITVLALYFICVDKIYILDQIEHHLPRTWVRKIEIHVKDLIEALGGYLKAEATLILVSFIISLVGLYIFKFVGLNVGYPLLIALFIGFVDALPILRFWKCYGSVGNYLRYKWGYKIGSINYWFINYNDNYKTNARTKTS